MRGEARPADKAPGMALGFLLSESKASLESEYQRNRHTAGLGDRGD